MNKVLSILAILMVAFVGRVSADDEVVWDSVSTASEFYSKIKANHSANIKLIADIDLSSLSDDDNYLFNFTFSGVIDGTKTEDRINDFKLYNSSHTIFKKLSDAKITRVVLYNCSFNGRDTKSAVLADEGNNTTLYNMVFSACSGTGDKNLYDCDRMGIAFAKAWDCHFESLLFLDCNIVSDGSYLGLITGYASNCEFANCLSNAGCELWADGNLTSDNSAYVGGFAGYAESTCSFTNCYNMGVVSSDDDRIGGVAGYSKNCTFTDCMNGGVVKRCIKDGYGRVVRQDWSKKLWMTGLANLAMFGYASYLMGGSSAAASIATEETAGATATEEATKGASSEVLGGYWAEDGSFILDDEIAQSEVVRELVVPEVTSAPGRYSLIYNPTFSFSSVLSSIASGVAEGIIFAVTKCPTIYAVVAATCITTATVLDLYNSNANADEYGGIVGTAENCSITRCTNYGPVECKDKYAGGIAGYIKNTTIESCYNRSFVRGNSYIAGIVGYMNNSTVKNCLNVGNASDGKSGLGTIDGGRTGSCTKANNFYLAEENATYSDCTAFTQDKLVSGEIAKTLNDILGTDKIWRQNLGKDFYPLINDTTRAIVTSTIDVTEEDLCQKICSSSAFYLAISNPQAHLSILNDINLNNYFFNLSSEQHPFKGSIYGHGHTLSYCSYTAPIVSKNGTSNVALFPFAEGAVFDSLSVSNAYITQESCGWTFQNTEGILVAHSNGCTYNNINIKSSSITRTGTGGDYLDTVGGIVANSNNDTFTDCSTDKNCYFQGYQGWHVARDTYVGGVVGKAYNSTFTRCWNAASIWADDDQDGGIAGYASGCTFDRCLNTGGITAQEQVGGICGNGYNSVFTRCVNTSWISDDDNTREDRRAGIVGYLHGSGSSISQCLNFGAINYADDDCGALEGCAKDGAKGAKNTNSFYYCGYNNSCVNNQYEYSDASIFRIAKINSGEFAYKSTIDEVEGADHWLYQDIDNNTYCTNYPVPIPAAGTVYSNILCDGTQSYSNNYSSTAAHTAVDEGFGVCSICGNILKDNVPASITISDAAGLIKVSKAVERGVDYSNTTITLANDIDLDGYSYTPIGLNSSTPFKGTFDGQGHRIKNMTLSYAQGGVGFFGNVSGANTVIKNLIIDSSCSVTSTSGGGVAGLIGDVKSTSGSTCNITIENCGNEATVTGQQNAAGIIGGVYNNDNTQIKVYNTYNTGNINGSYESASMCGYARRNYSFVNCYNSGEVTGVSSSTNYFYRNDSKGTHICDNCYDIYKGQANVISVEDVTNGTLCNKLNANHGTYSSWAQNIESDTHPVFGDGGITFSRSGADKWTTVVLPFDVAINNSDPYVFYSISAVSDTTLVLSRISGTLSAGAPAIVYMDETAKDSTNNYVLSLASSGNVSSTINNPAAVGGLTLTGVYKKTDITKLNGYKLVGEYFYNLAANDNAKTIYCEPYTAYLAGTLDNNAEKLSFLSDIITISNPDELIAFSNAVNSGTDYNKSIVILNNDIDMSGCEFTPIGSDTHPFKGIFNGNCHRIKNLTINSTQARTGFFGTVAGANTFIKNLIIDSSCSITSSACGTAGVIGGLLSSSYTACNVSIMNCGNEANITGVGNVAGVLGGVYANDASVLAINNCYNTGAISGTKESASICGYARRYFTILNSYNTGSLTGAESGKAFYRYANNCSKNVSNCYDINGTQTGVAKITADDVRLGALCQKLNAGTTVFAQDLEKNAYPTFGSEGLHYTRTMSYRWGTIVLPFDVDISDTTYCKYYQIEAVTDSLLTLKQLEGTLAAGTPALVCMVDTTMLYEQGTCELSLRPANTTVSTVINNPEAVGGLTLTGTYDVLMGKTQLYYIYANKFWYADDPINIGSFRAYIDGTLDGIKCLSFAKAAFIDGIASCEINVTDNKAVYNLAGQRLNAPVKGQINIIGGRKVLVK